MDCHYNKILINKKKISMVLLKSKHSSRIINKSVSVVRTLLLWLCLKT